MDYQRNFDDFASSFRERTSQRMIDFEKTLARAQSDVEKAAEKARAELAAGENLARSRRGRQAGHGTANAPAQRGKPGQVKSILRRS